MKIAVLGLGHMGKWLVQELRTEHSIAVYDVDPGKLHSLPGVIKLSHVRELEAFKPDMLINAVSLQNTLAAFESARPFLPETCMLCDLASLKVSISSYYERSALKFVSVHPMFGPTFADMASLQEENAVIISESDPQGAGFFREFFGRLGVRVYQYSFLEHDRMMAYSLTTPFISSLIFASCLEQKAVPGTTFKKHLAIAKSLLAEDDHLLAEILFNVHSLPAVENIAGRLEFFKHLIMQKDYEEIGGFIDKLRMNLVDVKS